MKFFDIFNFWNSLFFNYLALCLSTHMPRMKLSSIKKLFYSNKIYVSSATLCSKSWATLQHRGQKTFFIISELSDSHGHIKLVCRPCSVRRSKSKKRKKIDSLSISTNRELPLLSTVNTHRDIWIQTSPSVQAYL